MTTPSRPAALPKVPRQTFHLVPFDPATAPAGVRLEGDLTREEEQLRLRYRLTDPHGAIRIPAPADAPLRRDGLWSHTCLELFLALPGSRAYWEVNLCPSGDWNVYRLTAYRQGLAPEPAVAALPFAVERHALGWELALTFPLATLVAGDPPLQVAVTAVLEEAVQAGAGGEAALSYWALHHPGPSADFHHRDGFRLRI